MLDDDFFEFSQIRRADGVACGYQHIRSFFYQGAHIHRQQFLAAVDRHIGKDTGRKSCHKINMIRHQTEGTVLRLGDNFIDFLRQHDFRRQ